MRLFCRKKFFFLTQSFSYFVGSFVGCCMDIEDIVGIVDGKFDFVQLPDYRHH